MRATSVRGTRRVSAYLEKVGLVAVMLDQGSHPRFPLFVLLLNVCVFGSGRSLEGIGKRTINLQDSGTSSRTVNNILEKVLMLTGAKRSIQRREILGLLVFRINNRTYEKE